MQLYTYFRSSAVYRVRIALLLKKIPHEKKYLHLLKEGGGQRQKEYLDLNPQGLIPALVDNGEVLTQSLAIIEYLEERYPSPPLLPEDIKLRAWVRSIAYSIACDIHPLNNLRVLNYLKDHFKCTDDQKQAWIAHWITLGFEALEQQLQKKGISDLFCVGQKPTLADLCLIPQVYNALRFNVDLKAYPSIHKIFDHAMLQPAFVLASPEHQDDWQ